MKTFYYELCYFYNRKDSGSTYAGSERSVEDFLDEDEFLDYLAENRKISRELAQQVFQINEITRDEYKSFRY